MNGPAPEVPGLTLPRAAAMIGLAIGMVALAAIVYQLIDILLVFFLGIVIAAALKPAHTKLCEYGVPRGVAVLLIYLVFLAGLLLVGILIVPVLVEQVAAFATGFPERYAEAVEALRGSRILVLRTIARRLPEFSALVGTAATVAPKFSGSLVGFASGLLAGLAYIVAVLAVGFYWTMEVSRWERLVVSFAPVARRSQVLDIWHEIEFKLGAFIRGQGIAMVAMGLASGVGYALVGLPNVLALAVLAGLFEAVPLIGPILAVIPAILVALPLGPTTVLLVVGLAAILQAIENNILIPRIMGQQVGLSSLVGLLSVLAFGSLYGIVGVFIAIPLVAAIQVVIDRLVINVEPTTTSDSEATTDPLARLLARVRSVQQQMRRRFRERDTRIGIDPATPEHVEDAVDLRLEKAAERVASIIIATEKVPVERAATEQAAVVDKLADEIAQIERAAAEATIVVAGDKTKPTPAQGDLQVERAVEKAKTAIASSAVSPSPLRTRRGPK
jgi:predicted PurR-regulated permease PerM